ncbi:sensor domain-containing protein [Actinopolymorpha sp. B17G11]|uniref:sensor domain-containing protein n=1 Tax=Actinopolymorpha sp. B17G11 TaxID=3160861 RepID=UPI0032E38762
MTTAVVGATTAGPAAAAEPALTRSSTISGVGAPAVAAPTDALTELRRARAAMLVTDDAPYAGTIPWRIPRPDRIQVVGDPWDEVSHPCREATYAQLGGEAFRNRILVSDTATSYDASVEEDVLLFPDAATAASAYDQLATELTTCQERLAETGADLPVTYVGDVADPTGGRGTVWNADFATSDPEFLEDMTAAVVQHGRAIAVISVNRYGTLATYDPAAALPTAQAALTRLSYFD